MEALKNETLLDAVLRNEEKDKRARDLLDAILKPK